jgi:hypothetical protein
MGSIDGLVTASGGIGTWSGVHRLFRDGCVAKRGSNVVDGVSNFLHDARHGD